MSTSIVVHPHIAAVEELVRACYNYAGLHSKHVGMFSDARRDDFKALQQYTETTVAEALDAVAALRGNHITGEIAVSNYETLTTWATLTAMTSIIAHQIAQGLEYLVEQLKQNRNNCYTVFRESVQLRVLTAKRFGLIQPLIKADERWNFHLVSPDYAERIARAAQAAYGRLGHRQRVKIGIPDFHPEAAQRWAALKNTS